MCLDVWVWSRRLLQSVCRDGSWVGFAVSKSGFLYICARCRHWKASRPVLLVPSKNFHSLISIKHPSRRHYLPNFAVSSPFLLRSQLIWYHQLDWYCCKKNWLFTNDCWIYCFFFLLNARNHFSSILQIDIINLIWNKIFKFYKFGAVNVSILHCVY